LPRTAGPKRCGNPMRVAGPRSSGWSRREGSASRAPIGTLRHRRWGSACCCIAKCERGAHAGVWARRPVDGPGRDESPGEYPAASALIASGAARDFRKGQSPGAAACRSGPGVRPREQRQVERQVGPSRAETSGAPFGRGTLRRAESQERCRHETRSARAGGSKPPRGYPNPEGGT